MGEYISEGHFVWIWSVWPEEEEEGRVEEK